MINELFSFQKLAVNELRFDTAMALNNYRMLRTPQVVSLQAPTGSGKTIIMSALIEDIFCGTDRFSPQPDAIFVWLSDSPQLNEQSKQKIEQKADKIRIDQCVVIDEKSFDAEMLEEGHIYFLNTQKIGKSGNLSQHSDKRQYTIWETLENTAREKSDRLYFIIDEAHRGMQGNAAGTATTIMQRFIKGSAAHRLHPMPVVIGMSATAERFNRLVGNTSSTLHKVVISPAQVIQSGLLKDRIVITYPEDPVKNNDMAVLQAATDEWLSKCQHWYQYTFEQHYTNVNPVFVIQVAAGSGKRISNTDLDEVISKIEERMGSHFKENEVVHTFGSVGELQLNGLRVPHVEPSEIAEDRKIKVVLFKENLSTGWDCPRAETMMSFRHAEDATYIAQLLGRMIRTPLQCHIIVDDSLNDVRLFLPYFNRETVSNVIEELKSAEGGDIPTEIDGESLESGSIVPWSVHTGRSKRKEPLPDQIDISDYLRGLDETGTHGEGTTDTTHVIEKSPLELLAEGEDQPQIPEEKPEKTTNNPEVPVQEKPQEEEPGTEPEITDNGINREAVIRFINESGFLTYKVRSVKINSYLKSLLSLAGVLTQNLIYPGANDEIKNDVSELIRDYINGLHRSGKYDELVEQIKEFKLSVQIFDVFGEAIKDSDYENLFTTTETDLDRQLRAADIVLGGYGFPFVYGRKYLDINNPGAFKIDCILFAADEECLKKLNNYAEKKFHEFNDKYRISMTMKSEKCRKQYSDIIADGDEISKHNFTLPETINVRVEQGGQLYQNHLYADENGNAIIKLNSWERAVISEEESRPDFVCWLRNYARQSWSLRIPYLENDRIREAFPDFIIIRRDENLGYIMDILEPHNPDFKDNLGKAQGFADYAKEELRIGRLQLIRMSRDASGKERCKRLDLTESEVRTKVAAVMSNDELDHIFDIYGKFQEQ